MKRFAVLLSLFLPLWAGCGGNGSNVSAGDPRFGACGGEKVPNEYLVGIRPSLKVETQKIADAIAADYGTSVDDYIDSFMIFVATMPESTARRMSHDPRVDFVSEDCVGEAAGASRPH